MTMPMLPLRVTRATLGSLTIRMTSRSRFHSLPKFLRRMDGKKLNIGTNIKMVRILFNVAYPICEEGLTE